MSEISIEYMAEAVYSNILTTISNGWCRDEGSFNTSNISSFAVLETILKLHNNPKLQKDDIRDIIILSLCITQNMKYDSIKDEDSRKDVISISIKDYKKIKTSTTEVGDKIYKLANPDTTMDIPSMFYEEIDRLKEQWIEEYPTMSCPTFLQYCATKFNVDAEA